MKPRIWFCKIIFWGLAFGVFFNGPPLLAFRATQMETTTPQTLFPSPKNRAGARGPKEMGALSTARCPRLPLTRCYWGKSLRVWLQIYKSHKAAALKTLVGNFY